LFAVDFTGKLESTSVLKAICAGFKESTEPDVCLTPGLQSSPAEITLDQSLDPSTNH
jgi:hypothetical protein